ncbi:HAD family hydrolase [Candidatus Woesearchaeota archaeon]|nr:HAD family hydrolase [Candidatus Woesearchaeota archaeon]
MHIVFDWDGTLVHKEIAEEASERRGKTLGISFAAGQLGQLLKTNGHYQHNKEAIEQYTGIKDEKLKTSIMTSIFQYHYLGVCNEKKLNVFYPGILQTLTELKKQGARLTIATGLRQDIIEPALQLLGIDLFDKVYGNTPDLAFSKEQLVKKALTECGEIHLMVGDRKEDLEAGKAVKAKTAHAIWGHGTEDCRTLADYMLRKPEDLLTALETNIWK